MDSFVSEEVLEKLKSDLEKLKSQRKEIAERLKKSAGFGDLTENSEYQQAREDKEILETKIMELEKKIKNVQVKKKLDSNDKVSFYSKVRVKNNNDFLELTLVSPEDANFKEGKVSYESPLGQGLLGKEKGDKIKIITPEGNKEYEILFID
ncbi:MAG: GreA/GreB family elongation factor [Candidatus Pacebacteria bacterium]|nr:GreA/GreB family elongation factor [Candidatus Paceibacterota bacterium]